VNTDSVQQAPYQGLASIYDYVMRHVAYDDWVDYVHSLLKRWDPDAARVADLACGTGNISLALQHLGYEVTGVDLSAAMLEMARGKAGDAGAEFVQGDLRQLEGLGPFDAAVCIYDSFNYLLEPEDIDEALQSVEGILRPGGLFVFDVCTERNSLRYFRDMRDSEEGPGFSYERHSTYDPALRLQRNHFRIRFDGEEEVFEETHVQHIYSVTTIANCIDSSRFELLDALDGFTLNKGTENSDRIHFVLRAPGPVTEK
jgi:SAM-dependent methyltransferase